MRVSGDDVVAPRAIRRVEPDFSNLQDIHVLGTGVYGMTITAKGTVADVHAVRSLGPKLDPVVFSALRQWKFRPATHRGRPVSVYFTVTVNFHI
jgi:TonB family protein